MRGYRTFSLNLDSDTGEPFLGPLGAAAGAQPHEYPATRAVCLLGKNHRAPSPECDCGYYAYAEEGACGAFYRPESRGTTCVMAEVDGSGQVVEHNAGWRAERIEVVNFYTPLCRAADCARPAALAVGDMLPDAWQVRPLFTCRDHEAATATKIEKVTIAGSGRNARMPLTAVSKVGWGAGIEAVMEGLRGKFGANVLAYQETLRMLGLLPEWKAGRAEEYAGSPAGITARQRSARWRDEASGARAARRLLG